MAKATPGKSRTAYVCAECGASFSKWQGQCGECGAWNSLSEIVVESAAASPAARRGGWAGKADAPKVTALKDVRHSEEAWVSTGIGEFDQKQQKQGSQKQGFTKTGVREQFPTPHETSGRAVLRSARVLSSINSGNSITSSATRWTTCDGRSNVMSLRGG